MSTLLSAQSVGYDNAFGVLLSEISFSLKKGDRIGLIGDNGCGKSTLLQLLSGALLIHSGTVTLSHQCLMARIEQHLPPELHASTLLDAVLAQLPAGQHLSERWRCEALLAELGFEPVSWTLTAGTLSGGQHTRLLLARALIRQPDLLLLDEPSNHLDLPTLLWLEQFLRSWSGSFVLVSHDQQPPGSAHATVVGAVLAQLERQLRAGIARPATTWICPRYCGWSSSCAAGAAASCWYRTIAICSIR